MIIRQDPVTFRRKMTTAINKCTKKEIEDILKDKELFAHKHTYMKLLFNAFQIKKALFSNGKPDSLIRKLFDERVKEIYKDEPGRYILPKKKGQLGTLLNPNVNVDDTISEHNEAQ